VPELDLEAEGGGRAGARMKSGREHRIPLSERMVEIFEGLGDARRQQMDLPGSSRSSPLEHDVPEGAATLAKTTSRHTGSGAPSETGRGEDEFSAGRLRSRARALLRDKTEAAYNGRSVDRRRD